MLSNPHFLTRATLLIGLCSALAPVGMAELLPQAIANLPAAALSLERDNLQALRALPSYQTLRQMYSGKSLNESKAALEQLDIPESSVDEVAISRDATGYFGIVSGGFSARTALAGAARKNTRRFIADGISVLCPSPSTCIAFLADSLAAFGTEAQVRSIVDTRAGHQKALNANQPLASLLAAVDRSAPVIGVAPGSELNNWIGDALPRELLSEESLRSALSGIELFSYSARFDRKAHLKMALQCHSALQANTLSGTLKTVGAMQSIGNRLGSTALPFENLAASASGRIVNLQLDTAIEGQ
jgi:hypothetical protein